MAWTSPFVYTATTLPEASTQTSTEVMLPGICSIRSGVPQPFASVYGAAQASFVPPDSRRQTAAAKPFCASILTSFSLSVPAVATGLEVPHPD